MTPRRTLKQMVAALEKDPSRIDKAICIKAHKHGYTLTYDGMSVEFDENGRLTS